MNIFDTALVLASTSSSGDSSSWFALLFLLTGPAYFFFMYSRYRNIGARHKHETETLAQIANLTGTDVKVASYTDEKSSRMSGANHRSVRG